MESNPYLWKASAEELKFQLEASDPEGDEITFLPYNQSNIPAGITIYKDGLLIVTEDVKLNTSFEILLVDSRHASRMEEIFIHTYECPCLYDGQCETRQDHDVPYTCTCQDGYEGLLCDQGYSEWGDWTSCSKLCDYGLQERTRSCLTYNCDGVLKETKLCSAFNCDGTHI